MAGGLGGLGTGNKLFLLVDLDVTGDEELDMLSRKIQQTGTGINQAENQFNSFNDTQKQTADNTNETSGQFGQMFGIGMNLMFLGMAMQKVFGGLAGSMLKLTGVSQAFGAAAKSTLLPFFIEIAPLLNKIAFMFMDLPRPIKMTLGALVALLAVLGTLLFFGAQLALLAISLQISFTSLALILGSLALTVGGLVLGIMLLREVFKKFGPVVGMIAGILTATLSIFGAIAGAILGIVTAFLAVNKIFKKFGKLAGTIATLVVVAIAALLTPIIGLPVAIGLALGAVIAWFWNMKDEIGNAIDGAINFVVKTASKLPGILKRFFVNAVNDKIKALKNIFNGLKTFFSGIGDILGGNFKQGFIKVLKGMGSAIKGAINAILPLGLTLDKISSFMGGAVSGAADILNLNDFVVTDGGKIIKPHKNDTLIGTKNPGQLGGGSGTVNVEINDPVMKDDVDVQSLVDEVEERVNRNTRGRSSGLGS